MNGKELAVAYLYTYAYAKRKLNFICICEDGIPTHTQFETKFITNLTEEKEEEQRIQIIPFLQP